MKSFSYYTYTPGDFAHPELARATILSGGYGIIDLCFCQDFVQAEKTLTTLLATSSASGRTGIRVSVSQLPDAQSLLLKIAPFSHTLIFSDIEENDFSFMQDLPAARARSCIVEVSSISAARAAMKSYPALTGLIAVGNEAGGFVGEDSSYILTQKLAQQDLAPFYVRGGIGVHSAAACAAAGAAGVVLDDQLLLMDESPIAAALQKRFSRVEARDANILGECLAAPCRAFLHRSFPSTQQLEELFTSIEAVDSSLTAPAVRERVRPLLGYALDDSVVLPVGQAFTFAKRYSEKYKTTAQFIHAMRVAMADHIRTAATTTPLAPDSALAQSHGTRYPIVQGPMTRVSDVAPFADSVASAGALPMLALAMLRAPKVEALLAETSTLLADRPWGVGILGFVPTELREEQLAVVKKYKPPFAIIAGGRPDQAAMLEAEGIRSYIHVPTPELLSLFLDSGAERFIFEGRECGGHIGPLSSFVLWEEMVDTLIQKVSKGKAPAIHVLFAGGIHDALSAAMVSVIAAPLARLGIKVGTIVGTAYLFTEEAVQSGAILEEYQQHAAACTETMNFVSGPGHASRCARTPFSDEFIAKRKELLAAGMPVDTLRDELESLNLGRLRIASKGIDRDASGKYQDIPADAQRSKGMYMMGQVATLRDSMLPMEALHESICTESVQCLQAVAPSAENRGTARPYSDEHKIAIVGMSAILPGASDPNTFWLNVLQQQLSIKEVPLDRWDYRMYYDPESDDQDALKCKWGGFIDDLPFDPLKYGIPPTALKSIEPVQLIALEIVQRALQHAGYSDGNFDRENASVIVAGTPNPSGLACQYSLRAELRRVTEGISDKALDRLPEWTEESLPGILMNILAGRIANRFDLGGVNYTLDAACASSLVAIDTACHELKSGRSNVALAVTIDNLQGPAAYAGFGHLGALSETGQPRPFDSSSDGIILSEGFAGLVLKRLEDAEADGDTIYSVITGIGGSSDGKAKGLTAPLPAGQKRALGRAYKDAHFTPDTLGLLEAHATGTPVGDAAEVQTIVETLRSHNAAPHSCVLGSAKVLIGHTKATAGLVGVIKSTMALRHRILPPQPEVTDPLHEFKDPTCPVYLLKNEKPWCARADVPRRAGVSAFGFGGTNFHVVLEEYTANAAAAAPGASKWPCELLTFRATDTTDLQAQIDTVRNALTEGAQPALQDLAYSLAVAADADQSRPIFLGLAATSIVHFTEQLQQTQQWLASGQEGALPPAITFSAAADRTVHADQIACVFPGQGAQYTGMFQEAAAYLEPLRANIENIDTILNRPFPLAVHEYLYPPEVYSDAARRAQDEALYNTHVGQVGLASVMCGLMDLLTQLGVNANAFAGHSFGEFAALHAAGVLTREDFLRLIEARGRCMAEGAAKQSGAMAAVKATKEDVATRLGNHADVVIANHNSPEQVVISGKEAAINEVVASLAQQGFLVSKLPVRCAFHSPLFARAQETFLQSIHDVPFHQSDRCIYSNTTAKIHAADLAELRETVSRHLLEPVQWDAEIRQMYQDGVRVFIEVGPKSTLTNLGKKILSDKEDCLCVSLDGAGGGMRGMLSTIAQLAGNGVTISLPALFAGRNVRLLPLDELVAKTKPAPLSKTTYLLTGAHARRPGEMHPVSSKLPLLDADTAPAAEIEHLVAIAEKATRKTGITAHVQAAARTENFSVEGNSMSKEQANKATAPGAPQQTVATAPGNDVMAKHIDFMQQMLATHERVMSAYLGAPQTAQQRMAATQETIEQQFAGQQQPVEPPAAPSPVQPAVIPQQPAQPVAQTPAPVAPTSVPAVAATVAAKAPTTSPETTALLSRDGLTSALLELVSERTGYPVEILDLDQDLEAELGVDSIKRVEILSSLQKELAASSGITISSDMEPFSRAKSLKEITNILLEMIAAASPVATDKDALATIAAPEKKKTQTGIPRFVMNGTALSKATRSINKLQGAYFVTEGTSQVTETVCHNLESLGATVVLLPQPVLLSEEKLCAQIAETRSKFTIHGIVHLAGLNREAEVQSLDDWKQQTRLHAKSLFTIVRECANDFAVLNGSGPARILSATTFGGYFGRDTVAAGVPLSLATAGAPIGLLKTVGVEWKGVILRSLDFGVELSEAEIADLITTELLDDTTAIEIGYPDTLNRIHFQAQAMPFPARTDAIPVPQSDQVILITGGARGITAAITQHFARPGTRLILVGRTPVAVDSESPAIVGVTDHSQLRNILLEETRTKGEQPVPAVLERQLQAILQRREIAQNITSLKQTGAQIEYATVDVRTEEFGVFIDSVYERYGRIDGVIHGAGIIEDRHIVDKTDESFARVFDTKVDSSFILQKHLRPESLSFLVFFSSIAARFGNEGQVDYAAANEVMNRMACLLDSQWPKTRVTAINWGPWASIGMASKGFEGKLAEAGIIAIPVDAGREFFINEFHSTTDSAVEVIAGQGPWENQSADFMR